jgi:hypothetical protein
MMMHSKNDEQVDLQTLFKDFENSDNVNASVDKIFNIIKTFHIHEKLYNRMKMKSDTCLRQV